MKKELYLGLDVHKDSVAVALAEGGRTGEVRDYGAITNDPLWLPRESERRRAVLKEVVCLRFIFSAGYSCEQSRKNEAPGRWEPVVLISIM